MPVKTSSQRRGAMSNTSPHGLFRLESQAPELVYLLGRAGLIGIGAVQVLKLHGAKDITVIELSENREDLANKYGATVILDPQETDKPNAMKDLTDGRGVEIVFDAVGVETALNGIIDATPVRGTIVNIAVWEKRPAINVNELMYRDINYMGLHDEASFREVIDPPHTSS
ncbi:hypothetical protein PEBR_01368 [Penicillium brasilianum]|uniref:Alcohol dehydrogenase-like C-terminal domain-containing protein n=1 Tax=Penicillium brasilianum TaxID=104259 RepID=A0A1S9S110_PENBI|nr:hypothetical protein PEBR_01368 [Penicillium brasilianum]